MDSGFNKGCVLVFKTHSLESKILKETYGQARLNCTNRRSHLMYNGMLARNRYWWYSQLQMVLREYDQKMADPINDWNSVDECILSG